MKLPGGVCGLVAALAIVCIAGGQEKQGRGRSATALPEADLQEKLDVYVGRLKHCSVAERRHAVEALGRIGERAKAAQTAVPLLTESLKAKSFWTCKFAAETSGTRFTQLYTVSAAPRRLAAIGQMAAGLVAVLPHVMEKIRQVIET